MFVPPEYTQALLAYRCELMQRRIALDELEIDHLEAQARGIPFMGEGNVLAGVTFRVVCDYCRSRAWGKRGCKNCGAPMPAGVAAAGTNYDQMIHTNCDQMIHPSKIWGVRA